MNFLTARQLEIATRFVTRQIYRMDKIIIDDNTDYETELIIGDKCFKLYLFKENDDYYSTITFAWKSNDNVILSKSYKNERMTIKHWNDFIDELSIVKKCDCDNYFTGDDDMKYCDKCEPYIMNHINDCPICLTNEPGRWAKTPCNHEFHYLCLRTLVRTPLDEGRRFEFKCPLCRFDIKLFTNIEQL
jgi:hypothetical protein